MIYNLLWKTYRRSSSWLCANAWATRSKRIDRAVNGDAAPPELESPVIEIPCSSSRDTSADNAGRLSCIDSGPTCQRVMKDI